MNENSNIKYCSKRPPQKTAQIVMCALWVQCDVCYPRGLHACICFTCLPCWIHACFLSMCANTHGAFSSYVWYIYMTLGKKESFDGAKRTKNRCQPFKKLLWQGFLHVRYEKYNLALKANQLHLGIFARSLYISRTLYYFNCSLRFVISDDS